MNSAAAHCSVQQGTVLRLLHATIRWPWHDTNARLRPALMMSLLPLLCRVSPWAQAGSGAAGEGPAAGGLKGHGGDAGKAQQGDKNGEAIGWSVAGLAGDTWLMVAAQATAAVPATRSVCPVSLVALSHCITPPHTLGAHETPSPVRVHMHMPQNHIRSCVLALHHFTC